MGIVEKACQKTVIREVPGISDCFASKDEGKDKKPKVCTELPHPMGQTLNIQ